MSAPTEETQWLTHTLTHQIPLGRAMQLSVDVLNENEIRLQAPLEPNVNDKGTAFGGALVSMMILAGWSLPRLILHRLNLQAELVIGRCEVRFLEPVQQAFEARCAWPEPDAIERFIHGLRQHGKGRIELAPEIQTEQRVAARLSARYAAIIPT